MFRPLAKLAALICCLTFAACGGEESTDHATLIDESIAGLDAAVSILASADDSPSAKTAVAELETLSEKLSDLSNRARALESVPKDQRGTLVARFQSELEPAMGKLHAASLAVLDNQATAPALGEKLQKLESEVAGLHRILAKSLEIK